MEIKVYFTCGGGLGDCIISYICGDPETSEIPAPDGFSARWFRRLKDLKQKENPKIQLIITSHNSSAVDFFKPNPYIDNIKLVGWQIEPFTVEDRRKWTDHIPLKVKYNWQDFTPSKVEFYITEENKKILKEIKPRERYVVIHPFARKSGRELPFNHYFELIKRLSDKGIKSVVIGGTYTLTSTKPEENKIIEESFPYAHKDLINLANKIDITLIPHLILGATGFIGTHSCWILLAWWAKKKTISMFPDKKVAIQGKDMSWEQWKRKMDPYIWGFDAPFNKICWIKDENQFIDYDSYVNFLG